MLWAVLGVDVVDLFMKASCDANVDDLEGSLEYVAFDVSPLLVIASGFLSLGDECSLSWRISIEALHAPVKILMIDSRHP